MHLDDIDKELMETPDWQLISYISGMQKIEND